VQEVDHQRWSLVGLAPLTERRKGNRLRIGCRPMGISRRAKAVLRAHVEKRELGPRRRREGTKKETIPTKNTQVDISRRAKAALRAHERRLRRGYGLGGVCKVSISNEERDVERTGGRARPERPADKQTPGGLISWRLFMGMEDP